MLALLTAAAPLSIDIYTPSLPAIRRDLAGADWQVQASVTSCLLGIGVGQLLWGPVSDRHGRRSVLLIGGAAWTVTSVLSALAPSPAALIGARALAGVAGAAGIVVARSAVRDISTDMHQVSARIGALSTVTAIAPVAAPLIGAAVASIWSWRADFLVLAILGALTCVLVVGFVPETLDPARRTGRGTRFAGTVLDALRDRPLLLVALTLATQAFGFYAYITTASFIVERQYGYPSSVFALVFATNAAMMFTANLVFRRIVRNRHPSLPLGAGLAFGTISGLALLLIAACGWPVWLLWIASMVFAASTGLVLPGAHSWGQATLAVSGVASGVTGAAQFLGGVVGSPVTGAAAPNAQLLGVLIAVSSAAALRLCLAARRAERTCISSRTGDSS